MEPLESLQVKPKPSVSGYRALGNNDQGTKVQKNMQSNHRNRGKGVRKGLFRWDFFPLCFRTPLKYVFILCQNGWSGVLGAPVQPQWAEAIEPEREVACLFLTLSMWSHLPHAMASTKSQDSVEVRDNRINLKEWAKDLALVLPGQRTPDPQ